MIGWVDAATGQLTSLTLESLELLPHVEAVEWTEAAADMSTDTVSVRLTLQVRMFVHRTRKKGDA